jgi:dTDP-4-dehydrorhamnose 3,5-epimerase-like enzyme
MEEIYVKNSGYVCLKKIQDQRDGILVIGEGLRDIPFEIKRFYFITELNNTNTIRGLHAHKKLHQVIFCVSGSFSLTLDDGYQKQTIYMNLNNVGVILGPMLWHTMHGFSENCVLLVVASDHYDESDYIRDYEEFIKLIGR